MRNKKESNALREAKTIDEAMELLINCYEKNKYYFDELNKIPLVNNTDGSQSTWISITSGTGENTYAK